MLDILDSEVYHSNFVMAVSNHVVATIIVYIDHINGNKQA